MCSFGGTSLEWTAPAWFDGIELGVAKVWQGLKDFAGLVKSALINMLPDWLTDQLGWTVDGKIPGTMSESGTGRNLSKSELHELYNKQIMNPTADGPMMFNGMTQHIFKEQKSAGALAIEADLKKNRSRYSHMNAQSVITMLAAAEKANLPQNTFTASGLVLGKNANAEQKAVFAAMSKEKKHMSDYLSGNKGGAGGDFHSHTNTDASTNKGAVTVIQHLYADGSPTKATMTIHDHMDLNYGLSYNGYN